MDIAIIVDGASKGNGTYCGAGVVVCDKKTGEEITRSKKYTGIGTNNYSEYKAIQHGIEVVKSLIEGGKDIRTALFLSDSHLIINQIKGEFFIKQPDLRPLCEETIKMIEELESMGVTVKLDQVNRDYVWQADELSREAALEGSEQGIEEKYPFLTKKK